MDDIVNLLPIAAFIALAAGLAVVLRGTGRIVARTREVELFRGSVKDLAARVDASLGGAAGQIDAVRRRQVGPDTIVDTIDAAKDAVARYIEEAKAIRGPRKAQRIRSDLVAELERSQRALEMVEHGTSIMVNVPARPARAGGPDLDQARLPEPHPCARGVRPTAPSWRGVRDRREAPEGRPRQRVRLGRRRPRRDARHHTI